MSDAHVLIIDDEPGIAQLCERLLKKADFSVAPLINPREALGYLSENIIDLLLVDISMPQVSGFDIITRTHKEQPDAAVLVMTGIGTMETAIQALQQGVDGLILKPFDNGDELVKAARQALADNQKKRDVARTQAFRPLFDITESLLAETRPERLNDLILNAVCGHLRCNHAGIYQLSEEDHSLALIAGRGKTLPEEDDAIKGGILSRVKSTGMPLWVNTSGPGEVILQKQISKLGLVSVMCVPISHLNIQGVMFAGRGSDELPFREVEWEMFLLLVRQASIAMENARLYAELRDYVHRVEESQQALLHAEKMITAGRLTASIAHEINNPLQAVQNCLHLAGTPRLPAKKRQEYIDLARSELDRLMSTVQRMLDFYRPSAVDPQRVDIVDLLRHVISLLSPQLEQHGIHLSTGFSSRLSPILAVSSQLQQVFLNLILNAYDAMPDGGELRISARPVKDMVEIIFQDTGPGFPPETRSHIFEPFVSTKKGGTGLGLAVSYGIVAAHGGSLDILFDRGPGACVRVLLPIKAEKQ